MAGSSLIQTFFQESLAAGGIKIGLWVKPTLDKTLACFGEVDILISIFDMDKNIKKLFDVTLNLDNLVPCVISSEE